MTEQDDMTNGEIGRRLSEMSEQVRSGFSEINSRLDRYVLAEVHTISMDRLSERMAKIEAAVATDRADARNGTRWSVSTGVSVIAVLTAFVMGIITLLK